MTRSFLSITGIVSAAIIAYCSILWKTVEADEFPSCGDCWCVPDDGGYGPCPVWQPQSNFSAEVIETYMKQRPIEYYKLNCNPYVDEDCSTTPEQTLLDSDDAVCAYVYPADDSGTSCTEYSMVTFGSRAEAEASGAVVTHKGSCGLCSTTQDLALYLTQDFTTAGKICATKGIFNEDAGLQCYIDLGLSRECAKIWNYDGIYDGKMCGATCMGDITASNNGPPPTCELNDCLQCDEVSAGPVFSSYGGRTRRRSGLQSEIIRNCSSVARIFTHDPCTNPACGC